jgi:hypothetical protein
MEASMQDVSQIGRELIVAMIQYKILKMVVSLKIHPMQNKQD